MCLALSMVLLGPYYVPGNVQSILKAILCVTLSRTLSRTYSEQSIVVDDCNPNTQETEAGESVHSRTALGTY